MNRPPGEFRRISADHLRAFAIAVLRASGLCADHAELTGRLLVESDLRGVRSHGTRQLPLYCERLRARQINPEPELKILQQTETTVQVDGDGGLGYAPMMLATEEAIRRAKARKVALGAAVHIGHYGAAGYYVRRCLEEGCIAFSVQGGQPEYAARGRTGYQSAYWGNPPICFGLPTREEPPLVLDAATCILADYQRGPEFDALQELIPAAFFKSMGYTGTAMGLGGAFVGVNGERARAMAEKWPHCRGGGLIVVMDAGSFAPEEQVRGGIDGLVRGVREGMEPVRGYAEATLPGTPEFRRQQEYSREGVPLAPEDLEPLEATGRELEVEPGWLCKGC